MNGPTSTSAVGKRGEERAVAYLLAQGYRIVERNFRCRLGELDIVARDGEILVFVEVRTRTQQRWGSALEAITPAKQRQVARVASYYLARHRLDNADCRFDAIGITGNRIELIRDAFRPGL